MKFPFNLPPIRSKDLAFDLKSLGLSGGLPKMTSDLRSVRRRGKIVGAVLILGLLSMSYRAYGITVEGHSDLSQRGNQQQIRNFTLAASRGSIIDRNGAALAVNDRLERIVINPRQLRALELGEAFEDFLVGMFGADERAYIHKELGKDKYYRKLHFRLDGRQAREIRERNTKGVRLEQEPHRVYPRGGLAAHVLGRVNAQAQGNLGIELGMNDRLAGREASSPAYFASYRGRGKKLLIDGHPDKDVSRGHDIVLSIDSNLQTMAEEEIDTLVANWHPVGASIIIIDPKDGSILALTNRPTFDPNHRVGSTHQTSNLAVQNAYEPGSTMKAITVAAALEQGTVREHQTFDCMQGSWKYGQHTIHDTKRSGWLNVTEILAVSSNICTTQIAETLGKESLYRWLTKFHFGERPKILLPGATHGLLAPWRKWSDIQAANISFGHGMSASPLQVAAAFSVLANDGLYNPPTVVRQVLDSDGEVLWEQENDPERIVRKATAKTLLTMLTAVVQTKKGTGKNARIEGYTVSGKTSTAQKAKAGVYLDDQYYASFVGAVPAQDPRLVILVSVDNPEGGHYGNEVAAPTFARVGTRALSYLGVPRNDGTIPVPEAIDIAEDSPMLVQGFIPDLDREPRLPGERRVAFTTGLPDFTGLSLPQAHEAAERAEVDFLAVGSGIAVGQNHPPGELQSGTQVTVYFEAPE